MKWDITLMRMWTCWLWQIDSTLVLNLPVQGRMLLLKPLQQFILVLVGRRKHGTACPCHIMLGKGMQQFMSAMHIPHSSHCCSLGECTWTAYQSGPNPNVEVDVGKGNWSIILFWGLHPAKASTTIRNSLSFQTASKT
jgi:hypothetical protein